MEVIFKKSSKKDKKLMAMFYENGELIKTTHFGARGFSDYTQHLDPLRKNRYILRHRKNEDWLNPFSAGALSRWILWNRPTLEESIQDYKNKFGFSA